MVKIDCFAQGRCIRNVADIYAGIVLQQDADYLQGAGFGGHMQRSVAIVVSGPNVSLVIQQQSNQLGVAIEGRGVQWGRPIVVAAVHAGVMRKKQLHHIWESPGRGQMQRRVPVPIAGVHVRMTGKQKSNHSGMTVKGRHMERCAAHLQPAMDERGVALQKFSHLERVPLCGRVPKNTANRASCAEKEDRQTKAAAEASRTTEAPRITLPKQSFPQSKFAYPWISVLAALC